METRLTKESRPIGWRKREKREGGRVTEQEKKKKKKTKTKTKRQNKAYRIPRTSFELQVQLDLKIHV